MKVYVKPVFECVLLGTDERIAGSCIEVGSCYYGPEPAQGSCTPGYLTPTMNA